MRWPAVLVLIVVLLSAAIQPVGEFVNILREKVVLNSALMNACRAARDNSLNIWYMMNLDAHVNEDEFVSEFSRAFAKSLNLAAINRVGNELEFISNDGRFNVISITFDMEYTTYEELDDDSLGVTDNHDRPVTLVTARMETPYKFRTYWMKQANGVSNDRYRLTATRKVLMQIIN